MNQELILKILVGVVSSLIMLFLTYIFKRRQLYVVTENLYRTSEISNKGILCEISIFNRGRLIEEDIKVSLDNSLKYELVAFNDSSMSLDNNIIKVNRLHKKSKISVLLLVENGDFSHKQILQVDSKTEKGKIIEKTENIPPNIFDLLLGFLVFIPMFLIAIYLGYKYKEIEIIDNKIDLVEYQTRQIEKITDFQENHTYYVPEKYEALKKIGWVNLVMYENSLLSKNYFGSDFPIRFMKKKLIRNNEFKYTFEVFNKTTLPMTVTVDNANKSFIQETEDNLKYVSLVKNIPPLSKAKIETQIINPKIVPELNFTVKIEGTSYDENDFVYGMIYKIE